MDERLGYREKRIKDKLSFSCIVISAVFFTVLSQFLVLRAGSITPLFRPLIIFCAVLLFTKRGYISNSVSKIALVAAIYELFVLLFELDTSANIPDTVRAGSSACLYLLMCSFACATPWTRRELRLILLSVLFGCFVCAVVFSFSNNLTNIHYSDLNMLGVSVNRNKNAYAFALGTLLGIIYFTQSQKISRRLFSLGVTALMGYCVLYSQCRGAFICLVLSVFILTIGKAMRIRKERGIVYLLYILLFVVGCVIAYFLLKNSDMSRLVDGENTSGRDESIENAWQMFLDSNLTGKIFGNGFMYESSHSDAIGAHLVYATFLVSSGIVGTALISFMFLASFKNIKTTIPMSLLVFAFTRSLFEGLDYYIYIPLILAVILHHYQKFYGRSVYGLFS